MKRKAYQFSREGKEKLIGRLQGFLRSRDEVVLAYVFGSFVEEKNFQNLLKYDSKDKICKNEIKHFQELTSCHEVRKLGGLAYESVGRVFESPWARQ